MGAIDEHEIAKACARAARFDVVRATAAAQDKTPAELASLQARHDRLRFLRESLRDPGEATEVFERVLFGNELQPISYFERGAIASRAVARILIRSANGGGWGTGFLIAPSVLLTNHHVLPDAATARRSLAQFDYELDLADRPMGPVSFETDVDALFHTSEPMDFSVVAVRPRSNDGAAELASYGWLPLLDTTGKAFEGEWLTIVQHPSGERKQVCVRENRLIKRAEDVLWYSTDTLAGSSGSPVFNNDWFVVALHHSGIPETRDGRKQTVDGRDFDPATMDETQVKWIANEGIRASRICQTLKAALPDHALLVPMYQATPASARITAPPAEEPAAFTPTTPTEPTPMSNPAFPLDLRLRIEADGSARILGGAVAPESFEADTVPGAAADEADEVADFDLPFDPNYSSRNGFQPKFLKRKNGTFAKVDLPIIEGALQTEVARLVSNSGKYVLDYHNYSLVMHAARRLALYSAANIDFGARYSMRRPADVWRRDPRIKAEHQLENWYYAKNNFDRGHLTRREDLEYGATPAIALASAADTCHWTNCTPQHSRFNQNKAIWQGIERYILESTILVRDQLRAQVITGPVLDPGDPEYKGVRYPLQYWKVVAALDDQDKLVATAYLASQEDVIAQFGIEAAPFGAFKTFQVTVEEIERLTGLQFPGDVAAGEFLRDLDPLKKKRPRRRRAGGAGGLEASFASAPAGYLPLTALSDIEV